MADNPEVAPCDVPQPPATAIEPLPELETVTAADDLIGYCHRKHSPRTRLNGSRAPDKDRVLLMWATTHRCL